MAEMGEFYQNLFYRKMSTLDKIYTSTVYKSSDLPSTIKGGLMVHKGIFICSFIKDDVAGAFPHWANMLSAAKLTPTGLPNPSKQEAAKNRQRVLANLKDWHGSDHGCVDVNAEIQNDEPKLNQVLCYLVKHNYLPYSVCVSWAKDQQSLRNVFDVAGFKGDKKDHSIEIQEILDSNSLAETLGSFGYGSPSQSVKRVHFMDDLDDSGVVNQASPSHLQRSNEDWESNLKSFMTDKVWMEKGEVIKIKEAFKCLQSYLESSNKWVEALEEMDEEVRYTVNSLLASDKEAG